MNFRTLPVLPLLFPFVFLLKQFNCLIEPAGQKREVDVTHNSGSLLHLNRSSEAKRFCGI